MTTYLYVLLVLATYFLLGIGIALWLVPRHQRHAVLLIAPWTGYCFLTLAASIFFDHEIAVAGSYAHWLFLPAALFACLGLVRFTRNGWKLQDALGSTQTLAAAASLLGLCLACLWLARSPDQPTTMSAGNADAAIYGAMARYLKEFLRSSADGFVGQCGRFTDLDLRRLLDDFYFGPAAATAVCASLAKCMPHQIQGVCLNVALGLSASATFLLAAGGLGLSRWLSLGAAFLISLHPVLHFITLHGFFAQVTGVGLMTLLMWLQLSTVSEATSVRESTSVFPLFCLFFWGLLVTYVTMLPFVCGLLFVHAAVVATLKRNATPLLSSAALSSGSLLACGIVAPARVTGMIRTIVFLRNDTGGWALPFLSPGSLVGLVGKDVFFQRGSVALAVATTLVAAAVAGLCLLRSYRRERFNVFALGVVAVVIYCGGWALAWGAAPSGAYKSFKLLSFFAPLFVLLALSVFGLFDLRPRSAVGLLALAGCGAVAGNVVAAQVVYQRLMPAGLSVKRSYEELLRIDGDRRVASVNILGSAWWDVAWKSYFLLHKQQYFDTFSGAGRVATAPLGDWDLLSTSGTEIVEVRQAAPEELHSGAAFKLVRAPGTRLDVALGKGFYSGEGTQSWAGASGRIAELVIKCPVEAALIDLKLEYTIPSSGNRLRVRRSGEPWAAIAGRDSWEATDVSLQKGTNTFEIASEREPERAGPDSSHAVTFLLRKITITTDKDARRRG